MGVVMRLEEVSEDASSQRQVVVDEEEDRKERGQEWSIVSLYSTISRTSYSSVMHFSIQYRPTPELGHQVVSQVT